MADVRRRVPIGAELAPGGGVHFRVWAPRRHAVEVVLDAESVPLRHEPGGYFSGIARSAGAGSRYRFRLDGTPDLYPDPASRFQPEGPFGPSQVVDPGAYHWHDSAWPGIELPGQVFYELHVGTFTEEGTFEAAIPRLPALRDLGITCIELMPLHEWAGDFGWGYDGVNLFAPTHAYGTPDDARRFVDAAHGLGLGVILDVVYNHFGPAGCALRQFADTYTTDRYGGEWGPSTDFDGPGTEGVREYVAANAAYWVDELHCDGLRLDATQSIHDHSGRYPEHVIARIAREARQAAGSRRILLVAESETQDTRLVRELGVDALWNDDFHHCAVVATSGRCEAYYTETRGTPQELISALRWGYLYQGQWYGWQKHRRGTPALDLAAPTFVTYLENHDQIANSFVGRRLPELAAPARLRAMTGLWLLAPGTPLLFMGQEWGASTPFHYFADHGDPKLAESVRRGRGEFMAQFPHADGPEGRALPPDPGAPETFAACKLHWKERDRLRHAQMLALHRDLLRLRREDPILRAQLSDRMHGAVLGAAALCLRFRATDPREDRLLLTNLGADLPLRPGPEPLLAPPWDEVKRESMRWRTIWSSESPRYGGIGTPALDAEDTFTLPGQCTVLLAPTGDSARST